MNKVSYQQAWQASIDELMKDKKNQWGMVDGRIQAPSATGLMILARQARNKFFS